MLARDRLEERAHGVLPAAAGHARPLLSDGAEILEEPALARLDLDRVRVAYLEATDRRLEAPTPDVVRVGVPGDSDRRVHASPGPRTRRFAKKSSTRLGSSGGRGGAGSWRSFAPSPAPAPSRSACSPKPSASSTNSCPPGRLSSSGPRRFSRPESFDPPSDTSPSSWESYRLSRSGCTSRRRPSVSGRAGWSG